MKKVSILSTFITLFGCFFLLQAQPRTKQPPKFQMLPERHLDGMTCPSKPKRHLGGMACPTKPKHIAYLQEQGVRLIVSLTQEPLSPDLFSTSPLMKNVHIPIANHRAPTYEDAAIFLREANTEIKKGNKVVVHCKHGKGRTGTMLATSLIYNESMNAEQAIKITDRRLHKEQKQFLYDFYEKQAENR